MNSISKYFKSTALLLLCAIATLFTTCRSTKNLNKNNDAISICENGGCQDKGKITAQIQKILDLAKETKTSVYFPPGIYQIRRSLVVKNGVPKIYGKDAVLLAEGSFPIFHLAGIKSGFSENVSNLTIKNISIDAKFFADGNGVIGIKGDNVSNCTFDSNTIYNMRLGHGILLMNYNDSGNPSSGNTIVNNDISGVNGIQKIKSNLKWYPISLSSELRVQKGENVVDAYKKSGIASSSIIPAVNNTIKNNSLDGGTYGINITSSVKTKIIANNSNNNIRNISLQWSCSDNIIKKNNFENSLSSSILIAYGSSRNKIIDNKISSEVWVGEGLIKIGLGASYNTIANNSLTSRGDKSGEYFIYLHSDANHNIVEGNIIEGDCRKAFIALETAWNSKNTDNKHFAKSKPYDYGGYSHKDMTGNILRKNKVTGKNTNNAPMIYLGEIEDGKNGMLELHDTTIEGNTQNNRLFRNSNIKRIKFRTKY